MDLSAPWGDFIDIIALRLVKKLLGINPMVFSAPWASSLDIIALQTAKTDC